MRCVFPLILILCLAVFAPTLKAQSPTPNPAVEKFADILLNTQSEEERRGLLVARKDLVNVELGQNLIAQGRKFMGENDFPRAEKAFTVALQVGEIADDKASVALALRSLGSVNGRQGNVKKALNFFERAATAYEVIKDDAGVARSLFGVGTAQNASSNYNEAIKALERSLSVYEKINDKEWMSSAYTALNVNYLSIGDLDKALHYGELGLRLARESGDQSTIATSLGNLASLARSRGDYRTALEYNDEALRLFERQNNLQPAGGVLNNIGIIYLAQRDYAVAEDFFRRGLELRERLGDKDGIARSNAMLGNLKMLQGDTTAALDFLKRSVEIRENESPDPSHLAEILKLTGDVHFNVGNLPQAAQNYERALAIADKVSAREITATILVSAARLHLANGEREAATAKINRAVEIASPLGLREILWEAQMLAGEIALAGGDKIRARQNFETSIKIIEESRLLIAGGERERQQFFESKTKPYHALVELLIGEKKFEEAFTYAERAKARILLEVVQNGHAQLDKALTAPERAQETKLRKAIFAADTQIQTEAAKEKSDVARLSELRKELGKARNALDSFTTLLYVAHPELKIQRGVGEIAGLSELGKLLPNQNAALLEYVVTENRTFIFLLAPDKNRPKLEVFPVEIRREDLNKTVAAFREKISKRDLRFTGDAKKLYNLLLAPVAKQIFNKNRLIISPDAALWELPFQALIDGQNKYVVETAAVSYAPSLSVLAEITKRQNKQSADATLLAFGNPAYKTTSLTGEKSARPVFMDNTFADLPEAERQVEALSVLYGAKQSVIFTGAKATETEFKKSAADFKILHLATHGVLDDASPLYSYILLANDTGEDGRLEAREIMQMNLNASLVVLSACETARGHIGQGEGLVGLSWSFFVAGSPTTVASLWKVESESTTEIMLGFHRQMRKDSKTVSKAEALRQSSLTLLKNERYAHPFYWAGFVVIGDGR